MSIDIIITENPVYDASMTFIENITAKVDGVFSWTIEAYGGFATAHFEMVIPEADAWEMLNRIGKRVAFLSPDAPDKSLICWEGMISSVNVDDGGTSIARSMDNCYNRVRVNFTRINATTSEVEGQDGTDDHNDLDSQALYGKRSLRYVTGNTTRVLADSLAEIFLSQYANPRATATTLRRGGGASATSTRVSVDCVGFSQELATHFHEETSISTATIDSVLSAIVTGTGYGNSGTYQRLDFVDRTDTTHIAANTTTVTRYNLTEKTTRTYIDELMRYGDGATGRRTFYGYYENRKFYYTVEGSTYDYITLRNDPSEAITDRVTGAIVPPWLVRPGKIIGVPDLLPEETSVDPYFENPRAFCIGTVEFTAPATVVLTPVPPDPSGLWGTVVGYAPTSLEITPLPPIPGGGP